MTDMQMTTRLEMRWVTVTDAAGRDRMESRWVEVGQPATAHAAAAA